MTEDWHPVPRDSHPRPDDYTPFSNGLHVFAMIDALSRSGIAFSPMEFVCSRRIYATFRWLLPFPQCTSPRSEVVCTLFRWVKPFPMDHTLFRVDPLQPTRMRPFRMHFAQSSYGLLPFLIHSAKVQCLSFFPMVHPLYGLLAPFSKGVIILSMGYISVRIPTPLADGFHRIPMAYTPLR